MRVLDAHRAIIRSPSHIIVMAIIMSLLSFVTSQRPTILTAFLSKGGVKQRKQPAVATVFPSTSMKRWLGVGDTTNDDTDAPLRASSTVSTTTTKDDSNDNDNDNNNSIVLEPLVVCGPSGAGKGSIITKYMEEMGGKNHFGFTVSHTTRLPREGEVDGVHYNFVTKDEMKKQIQEGQFLEHAKVHGNYYGTSWASVQQVQQQGDDEKKKRRCLLDIDVQGVKNMRLLEETSSSSSTTTTFKPKYIFIAPPSLEILQERLAHRGTETKESLHRRTQNAKSEMDYGMQQGHFDEIVINDDLEQACIDFDAAIKRLFPDLK